MTRTIYGFLLFLSLIFPCSLFAQAASMTVGMDLNYYATLDEALAAAAEIPSSSESPVEITLQKDLILDKPLQIPDGVHIRLIPGDSSVTISRGANLIEYPVIWVNGDSASLTLGKPGMEHELFINGGYKNDPPIIAECPLVNVCGPDSKLIMYDGVTLQNNCNSGSGAHNSYYQLGGGVYIRTKDDLNERQTEFIMKGGTIRGNINKVQNYMACGGGLLIAGFGIFTMEGGRFMGNTTQFNGGGVHTGGRGTFRKTGGIIYGSEAPQGYRNTALNGPEQRIWPQIYGHAVSVTVSSFEYWFRDDTVKEDDNLSFSSGGITRRETNSGGSDSFGKGEKWNTSVKVLRTRLIMIILAVLAVIISAVFIIRFSLNRRFQKIQRNYTPVLSGKAGLIDYEKMCFTPREKEICELLLTELSMRDIAKTLNLAYSSVNFHAQNIYRKLDIQSRPELFVKLGAP